MVGTHLIKPKNKSREGHFVYQSDVRDFFILLRLWQAQLE